MSIYAQVVMPDMAQLLKEIGFQEETIFGYSKDNVIRQKLAGAVKNGHVYVSWDRHDTDLRAPLLYQAQEWLTTYYNVHFSIHPTHLEEEQPKYNYSVFIKMNGLVRIEAQEYGFGDLKEALNKALYKAIIAIKRHNLTSNEEAQEEKAESTAL